VSILAGDFDTSQEHVEAVDGRAPESDSARELRLRILEIIDRAISAPDRCRVPENQCIGRISFTAPFIELRALPSWRLIAAGLGRHPSKPPPRIGR